MGSICWACGEPANPCWYDHKGMRRCDPCARERKPIKREHVGKLSAMDRLPMARSTSARNK